MKEEKKERGKKEIGKASRKVEKNIKMKEKRKKGKKLTSLK